MNSSASEAAHPGAVEGKYMQHSYDTIRAIGTGLICGGLLLYQILSTRVLSVVLDEHIIILAISIAMLGMGASTSLASIVPQTKHKGGDKILCWLSCLLGVSYVISLLLVTYVNDDFNGQFDAAALEGGLPSLVKSIRGAAMAKMVSVASILFVPYFIFGLLIARLFGRSQTNQYHKLYAADLIGAAVGSVLAVVVLDHFGFAGCVALILFSTFAGGVAFGVGDYRVGLAATGLLAVAAAVLSLGYPSAANWLEPKPNLTSLARNYDGLWVPEAKWHTWNAYSRIALLELTSTSDRPSGKVYAHESGEGWADVPSFNRIEVENPRLERVVAAFHPKRVLVLFAGVGADMVAIDALCDGKCDISGVEINRSMVEHALSTGDTRLREFLSRPNINLHVAEAREFLERDQAKYDVILLSWWGAGTSQYVGTSGRLAEYLYTKEAFAVLIDHLTPEGSIVLYNGSKAQTLATLAPLFADRGMGLLDGHVLILRGNPKHPELPPTLGFYDRLEDMVLVVKPSGFLGRDIEAIRQVGKEIGNELILFPGGARPGYEVYRDLVTGKPLKAINEDLREEYDIELSVATDDRPFLNQLVPLQKYLSVSAWIEQGSVNPIWKMTRALILFVLMLAAASLVLIISPLFLPSGPRRVPSNAKRMLYFAALGAGFMAVEIGLVRKLGLMLGHPSYAISIVLASLIFSTGIGALLSHRLARVTFLTEKWVAVLIAAYVVAFTELYPFIFKTLISLPLYLKGPLVVAMLFPLGFLMGQLFPWGLEKAGQEDPQSVPWAWAINGTCSTIGSAVVFVLSFPLGFNSILYLGAAIYAVIIVLPLDRHTSDSNLTGAGSIQPHFERS
jgi:hypothetical protein